MNATDFEGSAPTMTNDLMFVAALGQLTIQLMTLIFGAMLILAGALLMTRWMASASADLED
ncbi:hypothetical protein BDS110ZK17_24220 [Bradyrhizobium diazoefficiens]|nr:hypothetical protein XF16B_45990 [Bradyrhizobium diazoefficiens]BCF70252.1 hypothetical protein XF19B_46050 [Bradyrhizobium diazoefficiens]